MGLLVARRFHSFTRAFNVCISANMRLSACQYIFYLTLILACGYANAGSIVKRESSSDDGTLMGYVDSTINMMRKLPFIGNLIANVLDWIVEVINLFEIGTNGALARFLGGALPCDISMQGISCSGLTNNGGFGALLMNTINDIPSVMLPDFPKYVMRKFIEMVINPTVDVLFGGVTVSE